MSEGYEVTSELPGRPYVGRYLVAGISFCTVCSINSINSVVQLCVGTCAYDVKQPKRKKTRVRRGCPKKNLKASINRLGTWAETVETLRIATLPMAALVTDRPADCADWDS